MWISHATSTQHGLLYCVAHHQLQCRQLLFNLVHSVGVSIMPCTLSYCQQKMMQCLLTNTLAQSTTLP
jgi:hypothetical protein